MNAPDIASRYFNLMVLNALCEDDDPVTEDWLVRTLMADESDVQIALRQLESAGMVAQDRYGDWYRTVPPADESAFASLLEQALRGVKLRDDGQLVLDVGDASGDAPQPAVGELLEARLLEVLPRRHERFYNNVGMLLHLLSRSFDGLDVYVLFVLLCDMQRRGLVGRSSDRGWFKSR